MKEASRFICPVSKSSPEVLRKLRRLANNRFLDAANGGIYEDTVSSDEASATVVVGDTSDRIINMDES